MVIHDHDSGAINGPGRLHSLLCALVHGRKNTFVRTGTCPAFWRYQRQSNPTPTGLADGPGFDRSARIVEQVLGMGPVDHVPERVEVFGAPVLVLEVVGVFPDVDDQYAGALRGFEHLV